MDRVDERFLRNIGIMSESQLRAIQDMPIAVAGLGMGGSIFINLVRLGFSHFHIADPDVYDRTNINRQRLAREPTLNRRKDECLMEEALAIFPDARIESFPEGVTTENVGDFLEGMHFAVEVIDVFAMPAKLAVHREARRRGIPVIASACLGFGASVVTFDKDSPTYEECSGVSEDQSREHNIENFARFIAPEIPIYMRAHLMNAMAGKTHIPFVVPGIEVAGAFVATEICKRALGIGRSPSAPCGTYIDPVQGTVELFEASYRARTLPDLTGGTHGAGEERSLAEN